MEISGGFATGLQLPKRLRRGCSLLNRLEYGQLLGNGATKWLGRSPRASPEQRGRNSVNVGETKHDRQHPATSSLGVETHDDRNWMSNIDHND